MNSSTIRLFIMLNIKNSADPNQEIRLQFLSYKDLTHPMSQAFAEALNFNLIEAQKYVRNTIIQNPLLLRTNSYVTRRQELDSLDEKYGFQSIFKIENNLPVWRQKMKITNTQFIAQVQTGDILLFTNNDTMNKMQRMITGS